MEIYEHLPTMIHCKLLIVDGYFVSVGSANFDHRSLRLNDEANFNATDSAFAAEQTRIFQRDLGSTERITVESLGAMIRKEMPMRILQTPFTKLL